MNAYEQMRGALVEIRDTINKWYDDDYISHGAFSVLWDLCSDALSAPPRQCDVGTAEEQAERFHAFCDGHSSGIGGMCDGNCPCFGGVDGCHCLCKWAQMPYTAQEGAWE